MRLNLALLMAFVLLVLLQRVAAWEEGDFEIFDLVDALENAEGKEVNFYSWLGVTKKTPKVEIEKAYRKMSRTLHPDKNKAKGAQEKYARLGSIMAILRNEDKRERYNFFLKNGVPRWRGSAYLYRRHRPGLKAVIVFLVILASGLQYLARYVNYKQQQAKMTGLIEDYKKMMREEQQKHLETATLTGRQRRSGVTTEEAVTPLYDETAPMYAVNQYGEEIELTLDNIHPPQLKDVIIARLPFWIVQGALKLAPSSVREKVLGMDAFESIRSVDEQEAADAKRAIRKQELAKKRAAKKALQRQRESQGSDIEDAPGVDSEDDEEAIAQKAKDEELAAARRRRRMKAPGQASLKGGRRG